MRALRAARRLLAPQPGRGAALSMLAGAPRSREPLFATLNDGDLRFFRDVIGADGVVTDVSSLDAANLDWLRKFRGRSPLVLRPTSTAQVSTVLAHCHGRRLAVVPQAGNTSLSGGSVAVRDEVVLQTCRLNSVLSVDPDAGVAVAQAGVTLAGLDDALRPHGMTVPLDLAAKARCQLGGNVSTNAGGLRLLRYGSLRGSVTGLEVVLPTGEVLDLLRTSRKDNTGLDLKQLWIGAEGWLGAVTAVALACPPRPAAVHVALLALPDWPSLLACVRAARRALGETLSALEFFDRPSLDSVLARMPAVVDPFPRSAAPLYLLAETSGSCAAHDRAKLDAFAVAARALGGGVEGAVVVAGDPGEVAALWRLREGISESLVRAGGAAFKYDLSLPQADMGALVDAARARVSPAGALCVAYGHLGDGNLHLNAVAPPGSDGAAVLAALEPFVFEFVAARGGSVSAEHGLGQMKRNALHYSKGPAAVAIMRRLKAMFDPHGIMQPGKFLPDEAG